MPWGEFGLLLASAVVKFKADPSELKAALKDLQGEEKKLAQAQLAAAEARNKGFDSWAKGITKASVVTQVASKALGVATDGWHAYEKAAKKAGGADEERARNFRGALTVWNNGLNSLMVSVGKLVAGFAPLVELAGTVVGYAAWVIDHIPDLGSPFGGSDFLEQAKRKYKSHSYAAAARGAVLGGQANTIAASGLLRASAIQTAQYVDAVAGNVKLTPEQATLLNALGIASPLVGGAFSGTGQWNLKEVLKGMRAPAHGGSAPTPVYDVAAYQRGNRGYQPGATRIGPNGREVWNGYAWVPAPLSSSIGGTPYGTSSGQIAGLGVGIQFGSLSRDFEGLASTFAAVGQQYSERKSLLEGIFGKFDEYDGYAERMKTLGDAVGVFSGALQTHFAAWVSGSESIRTAFKGLFFDTISGIASSMLARGVEHGAMAIGALAFGDVPAAATHAKASAANFAGAATVGALARHFGGTVASAGASGGASAGAGGGGRFGGAGAGGGTVTNNHYYGDLWGDENPRMQRQRIGTQMRRSRRYLEESSGVRAS